MSSLIVKVADPCDIPPTGLSVQVTQDAQVLQGSVESQDRMDRKERKDFLDFLDPLDEKVPALSSFC